MNGKMLSGLPNEISPVTDAPRTGAPRTGAQARGLASKIVLVALAVTMLSGCNVLRRLSEVGEDPKMAPVRSPVEDPTYRPISFPMPAPVTAERQASSLWRPGARAFFKDQRANQIGDILTVQVTIEDQATLENTTDIQMDNDRTLGVPNVLGFETELNGWLPQAFNATSALNVDSARRTNNGGEIEREEDITFTLAAVITQVLPNGNMVIFGRQELRVNSEVRVLAVGGVIRPEDIGPANTVPYDQIAEARLVYGGRGILSDSQRPPWGTEVMDIILPF